MIATIVKHQWFSGSPLPLNEWFGRNHRYQWFFNGFWSINHWPLWFFSLATIGLDGFAMVFGLATIGLNGFSMVANHWSNNGMVTIHRYGLVEVMVNPKISGPNFKALRERSTCKSFSQPSSIVSSHIGCKPKVSHLDSPVLIIFQGQFVTFLFG